MKFSDLINSIPQMPTEKLLEMVAFMRLELQLREKYGENYKIKEILKRFQKPSEE